MKNGLYKIEIDCVIGAGRGVLVVRDGLLFGGNSALALTGRYVETADDIVVGIWTVQSNDGNGFRSMSGFAGLALRGSREGDRYRFERAGAFLSGAPFAADLTAISEEAAPP